MADGKVEAAASAELPRIVGSVRNIGEPLRFANVESLAGFSAEAGKGDQQIKIWTRLALTQWVSHWFDQ